MLKFDTVTSNNFKLYLSMKKIKYAIYITAILTLSSCGSGGEALISNKSPSDIINSASTAVITPTTTVMTPTAYITISGKITYNRVNPKVNYLGLDYNNITEEDIRGATLSILTNSSAILGKTITSNAGTYSITILRPANAIKIQVKAELKKASKYNVTIVDNNKGKGMYAIESSSVVLPNNSKIGINLNAPHDNTNRTSAPFAILDNIYASMQKIFSTSAGSLLTLPPLKVNWSINNIAAQGAASNEIISSHYSADEGEIYILGKKSNDADEFDKHIIIHEWGHYFEHRFSRSDSIGGMHGINDKLDIRLAFGEGFGNALSAIVTGETNYFDSKAHPNKGFTFDIDNESLKSKGWWSEGSVHYILYTLSKDLTNGFNKILNVMLKNQKETPAFTSIFSFIHNLKNNNSTDISNINTITYSQGLNSVIDIYGAGQTNNGGNSENLPIYKSITTNKSITTCIIQENGSSSTNNKLGMRRYLRFSPTKNEHSIIITTTSTSNNQTSKPRIFLYKTKSFSRIKNNLYAAEKDGQITVKYSSYATGQEYIIELYDANNNNSCYRVNIQ